MKWLKSLFEHDYERDGPTFYDPKQPAFSLVKSMMVWVGLNLSIDLLVRAMLDRSSSVNVYSTPWLLLLWMFVGAIFWWSDKARYTSWLSRRCESFLGATSDAGIEKGVQR